MDRLSDYNYELPEELIAQHPLEDRAASRLLVLRREGVEHRMFKEALDILQPGDLLVLNDTRVSAVRLFGHKATGGAVEALLIEELAPGVYEAMLKPAKKLRPGTPLNFGVGLEAVVEAELEDGLRRIRFLETEGLAQRLDEQGMVPLPPYIHERLEDRERYQTVYGVLPGSAAAPTAGLHFTPEILAALKEKGVETAYVTLHVNIDTFRPVQVEDLDQHRMHGERCVVTKDTVDKIATCRGRVIAVGTTTVRTLESFATGPRQIEQGQKISKLFIRPGFRFNVVDGMFTNFHLPCTTMLLMISAMAGRENILKAYAEAVAHRYRFLSFGDSMLII